MKKDAEAKGKKRDGPTQFEQYKLALELLEKESDRFWSRNNVFLLIQAALISLYGAIMDDKSLLFNLLISMQAWFLAFTWLCVLIKGATYVARWDKVVRDIESAIEKTTSDSEVPVYALKKMNDRARVDEYMPPRMFRFSVHRTTKQIRYAIVSILIFWGIVISINVVNLILPIIEMIWLFSVTFLIESIEFHVTNLI